MVHPFVGSQAAPQVLGLMLKQRRQWSCAGLPVALMLH